MRGLRHLVSACLLAALAGQSVRADGDGAAVPGDNWIVQADGIPSNRQADTRLSGATDLDLVGDDSGAAFGCGTLTFQALTGYFGKSGLGPRHDAPVDYLPQVLRVGVILEDPQPERWLPGACEAISGPGGVRLPISRGAPASSSTTPGATIANEWWGRISSSFCAQK